MSFTNVGAAASDIYMPVSGEVVEINKTLKENPDLINKDAEGTGWMLTVKEAPSTPGENKQLLDADAYKKSLGK